MSLLSRIVNSFRGSRGDAAQTPSASTGAKIPATPAQPGAATGAPRPGILRRIRNAIANAFKRPKISTPATGTPPDGASIQTEEPDGSTPPKFKEINIGIEDTEALLAPGMDKFVRERGSDFWLMGFNDGIKGIRSDAIGNVAKAHAVTLVEFVRSSSQGKLKAYESDMDVKKKIMDDEEKRYRDTQEHLDEMTHLYHKQPRSFSSLLFVIYFSIAIFLIIADVPLAKTLTEKGFDLEVGSMGSWLLTLGIAFCAVYIKIYYDDYVATPIGYFISQFKKIPGIIGGRVKKKGDDDTFVVGHTDDKDELEKRAKREVRLARREYWLKFGIKTIVLIFTLSTIWILGEFRYQNISNPERDIIMEYVNWVVTRMGKDPFTTTEHAFDITLLAFRMITLIFPIIGGVCLSLALTNLQNIRRFRKAKKDFDEYQGEFLEALKNYNEASKKYQDYKGISDRWHDKDKDDEHTEYFTDVFKSYHKLGYDNGLAEPDFFDRKADLYIQVEKMRRKLVARRVHNALLNEATPQTQP
jgi:hypothetical protein